MSGQIVDHDDVAFRQAWDQHVVHIDQEGFAVHRPFQNPRRHQPVVAQSGREGGGLPMSPGCLADQAPATATAPMGAHHLGRGPGLVDEHQALGIKACLIGLPALPRRGHVGPFLLGRLQSFF